MVLDLPFIFKFVNSSDGLGPKSTTVEYLDEMLALFQDLTDEWTSGENIL